MSQVPGFVHNPLSVSLAARQSRSQSAFKGYFARKIIASESLAASNCTGTKPSLAGTLVMNLWIFPYMTLLSVFARDVLQQGPLGLGLMSTASGIGAFLGLMLINVVRRRVGNGWIYGLGSLWMCVMLFGFALSKVYGVSLVLLFCAGMGISCFGTMQSAIILITASDEMRSRVMGLLVLAIGADPLGQLQIGFWAERLGAPFALTLQTSLAALAIGLIILLMPSLRTPLTSEAVGIGD